MAVRLSMIPKVLLKPREAFKKLAPEATLLDLVVIDSLLSLVLFVLMLFSNISVQGLAASKIILAASIVAGIFWVMFIICTLFFSKITDWFARELDGKGNFHQTAGLIGYANIACFLLNMIIAVIILLAGLMIRSATGGAATAGIPFLGLLTIGLIILDAIVCIYYYVRAVQAAHKLNGTKHY